MISEIPAMPQPHWLTQLIDESIVCKPFSLQEVLQNSLYYPGADTDGKPVKWLAGNTYSFVYTDSMVSRQALLGTLNDAHAGFRGYCVFGTRDMTMPEVIPMVGAQCCQPGTMETFLNSN